jgi:hypothetical protein
MRFKHEQMFYDYKYMGHNKLTKLKEQMGKKWFYDIENS